MAAHKAAKCSSSVRPSACLPCLPPISACVIAAALDISVCTSSSRVPCAPVGALPDWLDNGGGLADSSGYPGLPHANDIEPAPSEGALLWRFLLPGMQFVCCIKLHKRLTLWGGFLTRAVNNSHFLFRDFKNYFR